MIANGGIDTHPDTGRTKLNIPTMQPNLSYVENGTVTEVATLADAFNKNSIRHLAVRQNGDVAFGMQWQGDEDFMPQQQVQWLPFASTVTSTSTPPSVVTDVSGVDTRVTTIEDVDLVDIKARLDALETP